MRTHTRVFRCKATGELLVLFVRVRTLECGVTVKERFTVTKTEFDAYNAK